MKEKLQASYFGRLFLWFIVVCTLIQCSSKNNALVEYPEDTPMSEYIIGTWNIVSAIDVENGNTIEASFSGFRFADDATVFYSDFRAIYKFTEPNVIAVDNNRVAGIEVWRLEREGNNLIVNATVRNKITKYVLKRCSGWWWC